MKKTRTNDIVIQQLQEKIWQLEEEWQKITRHIDNKYQNNKTDAWEQQQKSAATKYGSILQELYTQLERKQKYGD